jgi:type IV pilus assembly protein PilN
MTTDQIDLLRERRELLGEERPATTNPRRQLIWGTLLASALVGVAGGCWGVVAWLERSSSSELERLTPVQSRHDDLQRQIDSESKKRLALEKTNGDLARALVAVRSGSALMEDLRRRTPRGLQYGELIQEANQLRLMGQANDPGAFARINALQLQLQRSPLFTASQVSLIQARRDRPREAGLPAASAGSEPVQFELTAGFSKSGINGDLAYLRALGATGMAQRLEMLQRQGVLP